MITRLPEATREQQMAFWDLPPTYTGAHLVETDPLDNLTTIEPAEGGWRVGMVAHRGVLHPAEYVDRDALAKKVAAALGYALGTILSVYRRGPLTAEMRAIRDQCDAVILSVAEQGGNLARLGWALGWPVKPNGNCRTIENALARARGARRGAR